jgi:hypothetical protein
MDDYDWNQAYVHMKVLQLFNNVSCIPVPTLYNGPVQPHPYASRFYLDLNIDSVIAEQYDFVETHLSSPLGEGLSITLSLTIYI